jgi:hypothetical protein
MAHRFTSVGHAVERLEECEYFLGRMLGAGPAEFKFELNAFLSASRSVTFVLQRCLAHIPAFEQWYAKQREQMKNDEAMGFFLELRNVSQKQGPVAYVAGGTLDGWSARFVSIGTNVPTVLQGRDVRECCAEHLRKLAVLVRDCVHELPFHSCVARALTPEGMTALGFTFDDVEALLGLPHGYTDVDGGQFSIADKLRVLRGEVDGIDMAELERLADGHFRANGTPIVFPRGHGRDLTDDVASLIERDPDAASNPRIAFLKAVFGRIERSSRTDK